LPAPVSDTEFLLNNSTLFSFPIHLSNIYSIALFCTSQYFVIYSLFLYFNETNVPLYRYFSSTFHILDSLVILLSFTIDVLLHGIVEEVASLVIILRLWRFFKIIEEFSVGAQETMDGLELRIEQLEEDNDRLRREVRGLKGGLGADDDAENGRRRVVGRAEV